MRADPTTGADQPASAAPIAELESIAKTYEPSSRWLSIFVRSTITSPVRALDDIDLTVEPGQIKAIVGPNGAGKTTLFRIVVGLTTPTAGAARVMGFDATTEAERARRHIGFMPSDDRSLFMRLTCAENLRFHGRIHGLKGAALQTAVMDSLEQVGMAGRHDSAVFSLSAGMRARVQLARAILHRPALLVLDEPTATIDPVASHQLLELLLRLVEEHRMGALISSHRLEEIEALSTDVILLDRGRVRFSGDLDTLRRELDRPNLELVFTDDDAAARAVPALGQRATVLACRGATVECAPGRDSTVGDVLATVSEHLGSLVHCRELTLPLRDLLAKMYAELTPDGAPLRQDEPAS